MYVIANFVFFLNKKKTKKIKAANKKAEIFIRGHYYRSVTK